LDTNGYTLTVPLGFNLTLQGGALPSSLFAAGANVKFAREEGARTVDIANDITITATNITIEKRTTLRPVGTQEKVVLLTVLGRLINKGIPFPNPADLIYLTYSTEALNFRSSPMLHLFWHS
jgi:hypothetical protein